MLQAPALPVKSLYLHVPFCAHKCEYCAFFSEPRSGAIVDRYVDALARELELVAPELVLDTTYFGGGTPSLLQRHQWQRLFDQLARLNLLGAGECSVECNPATVSFDKARCWRDHGVNRVTLGVQSLDEALLDRLGRIHNRDMVFRTYELLRRAGFDNVGLDLMFAIPGQSLDVWRATLQEALALGSEHLSCYEVIYEQDTPLFEQLQANEFSVDEDLACAMYDELLDQAAAHGLEQYEVANFARRQRAVDSPECHPTTAPALASSEAKIPSPPLDDPIPARACRHNVNYWRGGQFHGLGPSAASFVRGVRLKNWSNTVLYCEQLERGQRAIESRDELPPLQRAGELAAFGLRMTAGWPFAEFQRVTGFDLRTEWKAEMRQVVERGWGRLEADRFALTRQGLRFADAVAELFLR